MESRPVEFQFKGTRSYIHGTDMFNTFISNIVYPIENIKNIRFIVHKVVESPLCRLFLTDAKNELDVLPDICARIQFDLNNVTHWLALTQVESDLPGGRYEYDEDKILSLCHLEDSRITLTSKNSYTFIENIVAMNKHLHLCLFPEVKGRWLFTRLDLDSANDQSQNLELRFKHNMNYRLTKSEILANGQKIGDLYFSLVKS